MTCPVCERGTIGDNRICTRCGVGVPKTDPNKPEFFSRRPTHVRPDQNERSPLADYASTKRDHE